MNQDPYSLENLILGAQQNVKNIRKANLVAPEDFDLLKRAFREAMVEKGAQPKVVKDVMRAVFEEGAN